MEQVLIECVPNFSEGQDAGVIQQISDAIQSVDGVTLLGVEPGFAANRTVMTMVGAPDAVCEAAFRAVKVAATLIDMQTQQGEHPRSGATDVCPLIPLSNITMEETAVYARKLAQRIGDELEISVYCYEHAALIEERKNLAVCRRGEYEGLPARLADPQWKPDFGPATLNAKAGATAVGARAFLIAYNINLNTTSVDLANEIAFDVREKGRKGEDGKWVPGALKSVKAFGWFIEEYGIAQVSMNLTDMNTTPIHVVFDEVCKRAAARGVRVTGSELIGLIPLEALRDAGRHYLEQQQQSTDVSEDELLKIAVKTLGLSDLAPFNPDEKIIQYAMTKKQSVAPKRLIDLSVTDYIAETASHTSVVPAGGSTLALVGALGATLGTMCANHSSHKRGWEDRSAAFKEWAARGQAYQKTLLALVDEDTLSFQKILEARRLPKTTDAEKKARLQAIEDATKYAIDVPLRVMEAACGAMDVLKAMVETGIPAAAPDATVGALCAHAAVMGCLINIKSNVGGLDDEAYVRDVVARGAEILAHAERRRDEIRDGLKRKSDGT